MEEAGDEPLFCERAAGIDIGKQLVVVTIRVPSDTRRGGRQQETREFGTTRRQHPSSLGARRGRFLPRCGELTFRTPTRHRARTRNLEGS